MSAAAPSSAAGGWQAVSEPMQLGGSPLWHPDENALYWCDVSARTLHRLDPASGARAAWTFPSEVAACVPALEGGLLLALRSGVHRFDPASGERKLIAKPRYDTACQRYSDGKADALGRFWCGTVHEPRQPAEAALYCVERGRAARRLGDVAVADGIAFAPDGRTLYWADTAAHAVFALDFDPLRNELSRRRVFARFAPRGADQPLEDYRGRPGGAAVDSQGRYWTAMHEGARLACLAPDGRLLHELALPVRCPTMPCFGGPDLRTLYVTSARAGRPTQELAREPLAGCVLALRVEVPGLPANYARWRR